jgi:hypothetical protein
MEMTFHETYHEVQPGRSRPVVSRSKGLTCGVDTAQVLEMMDYMFTYIFDGLNYR